MLNDGIQRFRFLSRIAARTLRRAEMCSGSTRSSSSPASPNRLMIGVAMGAPRRVALRGALAGKLISGLVTDEATAEHLLRR